MVRLTPDDLEDLMGNVVDWIEDATKAGIDLRAAIKEAHELLQDLKQTHREIKHDLTCLQREVNEAALKTFRIAFSTELDTYTKALEERSLRAMEELTATMIAESEKVLVKVLDYVKNDRGLIL